MATLFQNLARSLTAIKGVKVTATKSAILVNLPVDKTRRQTVKVTAAGIQILADRTIFGDGARRAFIVHPGAMAMFGVMPMFQTLISDHLDELRVQFDHINKARQWIGVPEADETSE